MAIAPAPSADNDARADHSSTLSVSRERPGVRQQVMAERDRLGEARVRRARHHGLGVLTGTGDQRLGERDDQAVDRRPGGEQPQLRGR